MRRFLHMVTGDHDERPTVSWEHALSPALVATLVAEGILEPAPDATTWRCEGGGFEGCPRRIFPGTAAEAAPFIATCGAATDRCDDQPLQERDVKQLAVAFDRLVDTVRDRLGITERGQRAREVFTDTFALGTIEREGRTVDVCLALRASSKVFPHFIASRNHRDTIMLVTNPWRVPDALWALHGPGARVELVLLEDVLGVDGDHIAARGPWLRPGTAPAAGPAATVRLYTEAGERQVTPSEAAEVASREQEFDLFIDGVHSVSGRKGSLFRVSVSLRNGAGRHDELVGHYGTAALVALVARRAPMRPDEIPALNGMGDKGRIIERARKALEDAPPWRWFLTRRGLLPDDNTFEFVVPKGARFAVLVPLGGVAARRPRSASARK